MSRGDVPRTIVAAVSLFALVAQAAEPVELLCPSGFVTPEGFAVGVRRADGQALGGLNVTAKNADVQVREDAPDFRSLWVTPKPGAREVELEAAQGSAKVTRTVPVGPPAASVSLRLLGAVPVKNKDTQAELSVELLGADGKPDGESAPPVIRTNVGKVTGLTRTGPGQYRATYELPTTRYPEVAVAVAFSAWPHSQSVHGAFGVLRVPLASFVELPGQTERDAEFSIQIAGQKFGPVRAASDGRFKVPVIVPPGYGTGIGTAVDRLGNKRNTSIDLQLPPVDQLACVASPRRLPADGVTAARVLCATSDPFGNATAGAKVKLTAEQGALSAPRALDNGVIEWTYTAPRKLESKPESLKASWKQGKVDAKEELEIELVQGAVAQCSASLEDDVVHRGGRVGVTLTAKDALGRVRPGAKLEVEGLGGSLESPAEPAPGTLTGFFRASVDAPNATSLQVRAFGPPGDDASRLIAWVAQDSIWVAVTDLAGLPVPRQPVKLGAQTFTTDETGVARLGPVADGEHVIRHAEWTGLSTSLFVRGKRVFPQGVRPECPPVSLPLRTAPGVPVNLRAEVVGRELVAWLEGPRGELLPPRALGVTVAGGRLGQPVEKEGRLRWAIESAPPKATIVVTDPQSAAMALVVAP